MKTPLEIIIEELEGVDKLTLCQWFSVEDRNCRCPIGYIIQEPGGLTCWKESYESRAAKELGVTEDWVGDFVNRIDKNVLKWYNSGKRVLPTWPSTDEERAADSVFMYILDNFSVVEDVYGKQDGFKFVRNKKEDGATKADTQGLSTQDG
jgi:hypothetical protein